VNSKDICEQYGMLIWPEAQILKNCVKLLPENPIIVNIGAGTGTSVAAMLEERSDAYIFSVDKDPVPLEKINVSKCDVDASRFVRLLGKSWTVGWHFPFTVHMVFVDGDHGNDAVQKDIVAWKPKIRTGGIMAFHDYKHPNVPELTKIVDAHMEGHKIIDEHRYMIAFQL